MSDLTKTLKAKILDVENARGPAKHILNDRLADLGQVAWDYGDEIISALKTVRGIEGLTDTEGNSVLFVHKNADFNGLPNCCIEVTTDWDQQQIYRADTFAECVDAAVGANKKGEN